MHDTIWIITGLRP